MKVNLNEGRDEKLARVDAMVMDIESAIPEETKTNEVVVACLNIIGRALFSMKDREEALEIADKLPRVIRGVFELLDGKVSEDEVDGVNDDEAEGVSDAEEELRAGAAAGGEA